jgi:ABC-type glycerol-3-phosphate transport system substrate-binding protein
MNWTGPWQITTWQQTKGFHFGVAPMPTYNGKDYSNICWAGFAMNARTKNPEAAWQVIKALGGPIGSAVFAKWALPAVKTVAGRLQSIDPASYPYRKEFLALVKNVPGTPGDMRNPDGHAAVETPYENAISHLTAHPGSSVKAALDDAAAKGQQELSNFMSNQ